MKLNAIKVNYEVLGQQHFFYTGVDPKVADGTVIFPFSESLNAVRLPEPEEFLSELQKISKTAHITSVTMEVVSLEEYQQHSFETVLNWNLNTIEKRFSHIDKEAIE